MNIIRDFSEGYTPWSGAVDTYNKIQDADKWDALEMVLEDMYPDGITETQLNDLLWFEPETVLEWLGIEEETEEEDKPETNPADYKSFDDFCQDCDHCPFADLPGGVDECKKAFIERKEAARAAT